MTSEEEIAAVVAVLAALQAPVAPPEAPQPLWAAPARLHRRSFATPSIHGGWVTSSRPH